LVASFAILLVKDYPTQPAAHDAGQTGKVRAIAKALLGSPTALYSYLGGAMQLSVIAILFTWLASFFNRTHAMPVGQAAIFAAVTVLLGAIGSVVWGRSADFWGIRNAKGRLYVPALGSLFSAMLLGLAFASGASGTTQIALIMAGSFVATASLGPINSVVIDVVPPGLRVSATAMISLVQNLFGLAAGPLVIGILADRYGLAAALGALPLFALAAMLCFIAASRYYPGELSRMAGK
jgi:MFS family permease